MRSGIIAILLITLSGCASHHHQKSQQKQKKEKPTTHPVKTDDRLHYDDPRLSDLDRHVVHAATEAILDPKLPRPNLDRTFRYEIWERGDGWYVRVWRLFPSTSQPTTQSEKETWVAVDKDFHARVVPAGGDWLIRLLREYAPCAALGGSR